MIKRVISLILCLCLIVDCSIQACADEKRYVNVMFDVGSGVIEEKGIVHKGDIFLAADSFSLLTRYTFVEEDSLYLIDGQELNRAFKSVAINTKSKYVLISGTRIVDIPEMFEIDGTWYLPMSVILPILNADIFLIEDDIIYISNNTLTLGEVLYDFDMMEYLFDYEKEFANNAWQGKFFLKLLIF